MVIALCRAYDRSPVQGLIETEYINDYEVQGPDVAIALEKATNKQLLPPLFHTCYIYFIVYLSKQPLLFIYVFFIILQTYPITPTKYF